MKLRLHKEQVENLVVDALVHGIPKHLIEVVLYLADKAYFCGRADRQIERPQNQEEYQLDMNTLEGIAQDYIEKRNRDSGSN